MTELVTLEERGVVAHLTLNAPHSLNALSDAMIAALKARLTQIAAADHIRVVVLKGAGKAFCAGHDLKEMQAGRAAPDQGRRRLPAGRQLRHGGRRRRHALWGERGEYRAVLLHADGRA